jgi:hypothetical protein
MIEDDDRRRAAFAKMNEKKLNTIRTESRKKGKGWHEEKDIRTGKAKRHQEAASKNNSLLISNARIIPDSNFVLHNGKQALPILLLFSGLPTSGIIAKATFDSIEDALNLYYKSNKIDDALIVGLKSFLKNYAKNYPMDYLQQNMQNRTDDNVFNELLEGIKIISSIIIENI